MSSNGQHSDPNHEKPVPRGPASPARVARIQAQNRRREYLERHPSYFDSIEHELADPVLYGRFIKPFQSAEERSEEGKAKGYGRMLEASLIRGETNLANLRSSTVDNNNSLEESAGSSSHVDAGNGHAPVEMSPATIDQPWHVPPADRQQGLSAWRAFLEHRFIHGRDDDFDYARVDNDEDLDVLKRMDSEDRWFDDEEPSWVNGTDESGRSGAVKGETGIQDY